MHDRCGADFQPGHAGHFLQPIDPAHFLAAFFQSDSVDLIVWRNELQESCVAADTDTDTGRSVIVGAGTDRTCPPSPVIAYLHDAPHMPATDSTSALRIHQFRALQPGTRLIVTGAVHGNETSGTQGILRVVQALDAGALVLRRGSLCLLPVTNPLAYARGQRIGERNLNRNLYPNAVPQDYEDRVANVLCPLLAEHDVLLDLHSFHAQGEPFVMLGPQENTGTLEPFTHAQAEQALALRLGPRRIVEGWLQTYAEGVRKRLARTRVQDRAQLLSTDPRYGVGTTEYMRSQGGYALTLECGQHQDPAAPEVAWRAITHTLAHLGMIDAAPPQAVALPQLLRLTEVIDKHHAADRFTREWASYDPVARGDCIGIRHDGTPVLADADGFIVFPNPGATAGNEWFYFALPGTRDLGS